jgi:hypothetical protein
LNTGAFAKETADELKDDMKAIMDHLETKKIENKRTIDNQEETNESEPPVNSEIHETI